MPKIKSASTRNKYGLTRHINEEIAREVRVRCGFGCVICGLGLYEYEHFMPEFKNARFHMADGITLLCPNHHDRKTRGMLPVEVIKKFNATPKALQNGAAGDKFFLTAKPTIIIGTAKITSTPVVLQIENEPILIIQRGEDENEPYLITANLHDKNGELILAIENNVWETPNRTWDCKSIGRKIEIRSAPRNIELVLRKEIGNVIVIERLSMFHRGYKIMVHEGRNTTFITPTGVNLVVDSCEIDDCLSGILLFHNAISLGFGGGSVRLTGGSSH